MFEISRLRERAEGEVAEVKKRVKPPDKLSWKVTGIVAGFMAVGAGGFSINHKTQVMNWGRFTLIYGCMLSGLYLFAKANREGRLLTVFGSILALVVSGAPSTFFGDKSNGEQAWVAFASVSDFTSGFAAGPLAAFSGWVAHGLGVGFGLLVSGLSDLASKAFGG